MYTGLYKMVRPDGANFRCCDLLRVLCSLLIRKEMVIVHELVFIHKFNILCFFRHQEVYQSRKNVSNCWRYFMNP